MFNCGTRVSAWGVPRPWRCLLLPWCGPGCAPNSQSKIPKAAPTGWPALGGAEPHEVMGSRQREPLPSLACGGNRGGCLEEQEDVRVMEGRSQEVPAGLRAAGEGVGASFCCSGRLEGGSGTCWAFSKCSCSNRRKPGSCWETWMWVQTLARTFSGAAFLSLQDTLLSSLPVGRLRSALLLPPPLFKVSTAAGGCCFSN